MEGPRRVGEDRLPDDAPESDVLEQSRDWEDGDEEQEERSRPSIPLDAPEADVLEQSRQVDLEDDRDRG